MTKENLEKYGEKLSFLFKTHFLNRFELFNLEISDYSLRGQELESISIDIECDYMQPCDGSPHDVSYMITKIDKELIDFLYEFPLNPKNFRIDPSFRDVAMIEGLVVNFEYKLDELHKILMSYRCVYDI